ncbi:MAG: glycoside hydrolase family 5 protein [Oscillospiraceae bacterium]|nr:glycoside hydrolase family 5 protein [Oscillospiraceae bacterium]
MKNMKKTAAFITAVTMIMSLSACQGDKLTPATPASDTQAQVTEQQTAGAANPAVKPARDIPSIELVKEMKVGWNLGNTFDAVIGSPNGTETPKDWETAWGQPETTKALIDQVAAQGFNVFRLPVTWDGKFGEGPDYKINEDWLARVQQVADWALEDDMFVIINCHHEEWNMPTEENTEKAEEITRALWGQIADHFADYDEHLIFECMNEPRLKGTPMEWNGGNDASRQIINRWNAAFVETVRSKGGNNKLRHLMIPGYAASSSEKCLKDIVIPDESDDKIIVSVHAYLPYTFALAEEDQAKKEWSADDPADTRDIQILLLTLKELFLDKGRAVIIGEFGTRNRFNTDARVDCARYYITKATQAGVPCVWWDNNAFVSGEAFGLIDRRTFEWRYPAIIEAMMTARKDTEWGTGDIAGNE